jgi:hypothetical protein
MACSGIEFCTLSFARPVSARRCWRRSWGAAWRTSTRGRMCRSRSTSTGCPNWRARIQVADIGCTGQVVEDCDCCDTEGFQVHLGGSLGQHSGPNAAQSPTRKENMPGFNVGLGDQLVNTRHSPTAWTRAVPNAHNEMPLKRPLPRHAIAIGMIVGHAFIMASPAPPMFSTPHFGSDGAGLMTGPRRIGPRPMRVVEMGATLD